MVKFKGQPGIGFASIPRISSGYYAFIKGDDLFIRARPRQPYKKDRCSEFYRVQMQASAAMIGYAIPLEIEGSHNWQVNSNDTWKDALTRAQFGTLMRIILEDGTEYHPADHSCPSLEIAGTGDMPWTLASLWEHSVSGNTLQHEFVFGTDYKELYIILDGVARAAADWIVVRCSTDNGATYPGGVGTYIDVNSVGVASTIGAFFFPQNFTTAATSGQGWIGGCDVGKKLVWWGSTFSTTATARFIANNDPVNAIKVGPTNFLTNMTSGRIAIFAR